MKKFLFRVVLITFVLAFIGIQYIEVDRTNPPVKDDLNAPADVKNILRTSCYDCHSFETKWPWYSKVAPVSWLIIDDVEEGRKHLNFSLWESLNSSKKDNLKKEIWEELVNDEMPLKKYTYLHPNSSLEVTQKNILKRWLHNSEY
ncbi:MAG: heme-binding domain-containing protein [Melioribacteraceae bacterium]